MKNIYQTSLKIMTTAIFTMVLALASYSSLNAQLVAVTDANSNSFCDSSCDTLDLSVDVYFNGQLYDPPAGIGFTWTGPDGFTSNQQNPRVPITSQDQMGDYCVVLSSFGSPDSAPDCQSVDVEPTIEWTCPASIMVTGADCSTDLVNYSFTINDINCPPDPVNWQTTIFVNSMVFFTGSGSAGSGDQVFVGTPQMVNGQLATVVDSLPFGVHELVTTLTDPSDPSKILAQCRSNLRVVESINNVACNDNINITLNEECEGTLTPDMILQGDYCYENFTLEIDGYPAGNTILLDAPGDYTVSVTGLSGISCWGTIHAEDKSRPVLDCEDFEVYCSEVEFISPGSIIRGFDRARVEDVAVAPGATRPVALLLDDVSGTVLEIEMLFHGEIPRVNDLGVTLTDPSGGQTISLLDLDDGSFFSQCTESNLYVCLADDAPMSHNQFGSPEKCRSTLNAFIGRWRPEEAFANFNGTNAFGNWTLNVTNNSGTEPMNIAEVDFRVITNEGTVPGNAEIIMNTGCSNPVVDGPNDMYVGVECEDGYWNTIERTYTVTNTASGLSASCTQNINLLRWTLDDIIWPKSYNDIELPVFQCWDLFDQASGELDESLVDSDTIPLPSVTGRPTVPFGDVCGNFQMTKSDLKFRICGKFASKVIRTWSVLDWCTGEIAQYDQIIKIVDDQPIEISCQPDFVFEVYTDSYSCSGDWNVVPPLNFSNSCDADITWDVAYQIDDDEDPNSPPMNGQYIQDNVTYKFVNGKQVPDKILDLPAGRRTWVRYTATDECGNSGECFTEVDVFDDDKPNPVCIEFTVVALSNDGCAKLHAESLDNGSWDNCGIELFEIRKQNSNQWRDYVEYCCDCVLANQSVFLRVTDINGNTNSCEVAVKIQDNIPPTITQRPQTFFNFDCSDGPVDVGEIITNSLPQFAYEDNCDPNNDGSFSIRVDWTRSDGRGLNDPLEPGSCGLAGLSVTYDIRDECNRLIGNHTQNININNGASTFFVNWPLDPPPFNNCSTTDGLHPDNLAPQFTVEFSDVNTFACNSSIAITYDDLVFENVEGSCLKILRTWTVIDWCIADAFGLARGTQSYTQVLRVHDLIGPSIDVPSVVTVNATTSDCFVNVQDTMLIADVSDACTDMFSNQDVTIRYVIEYANGSFTSGTGNDARGSFPYGSSTITWIAEDHCGNVSERTTRVDVRDVKAPTPYCLGIVVTATMTDNGPVEIWAQDFNLGSDDNVTGNTACGNNEEIDVYFLDEFNNETDFLAFDCDDILNGISQLIELQVYYEDEAGNVDFCVVTLNLQDNVNDVCPDSGMVGSISGRVETENRDRLENVKVDLVSNTPESHQVDYTNITGAFAFPNLQTGLNYNLTAYLDDEPMNGVSTLDLVLIQRHILGISQLDSPYKLIAADADNSNNVSATDLITLRKLILGIFDEFPNGQKAWRFPEKDQDFADQKFPFPYDEEINIMGLGEQPVTGQNFIAVKIGDVNGSVELNANGPGSEERSYNSVVMEMDEKRLSGGSRVNIPVYSPNVHELIGFQNTLNFDPEVMEFVELRPVGLDVTEENLGLYAIDNGLLSMSWHTASTVSLKDNEPLFELVFDVKEDAHLSDVIFLSSNLTRTEAYNKDLDILDVELAFRGDSDEFVLYQNIPNPFAQSTEIRFSLPADSDVTFTVFDVNGRILMTKEAFYTSGNHSIEIHQDDLQADGVMYYTIETDSGVASRKMIRIK